MVDEPLIEIARARHEVYTKVAADLRSFGGHLECMTCHRRQALGFIAVKLQHGWPMCCGYTMRWITARQVREAGKGT
jgi:hypothetical protein